jgi:hypothetical protein
MLRVVAGVSTSAQADMVMHTSDSRRVAIVHRRDTETFLWAMSITLFLTHIFTASRLM